MAALYHMFPATIHPMIVHFTIAIVYLAGLAGVVGLFWRADGFWPKMFFLMLFFGILATLAAGVAGAISESYISTIPSGVGGMFETHKFYGELTGVCLVIAFFFQAISWFRNRKDWRVSIIALIFTVVAVVLVSMAGHLGGTMVYQHGFGVH